MTEKVEFSLETRDKFNRFQHEAKADVIKAMKMYMEIQEKLNLTYNEAFKLRMALLLLQCHGESDLFDLVCYKITKARWI